MYYSCINWNFCPRWKVVKDEEDKSFFRVWWSQIQNFKPVQTLRDSDGSIMHVHEEMFVGGWIQELYFLLSTLRIYSLINPQWTTGLWKYMKAFWFGLDIEEKLRYSRVAQMISNCKRREEKRRIWKDI